MSEELPIIYVARHGETAWSLTGQHTGLTDLPLMEAGEQNALRLAERLKALTFMKPHETGRVRSGCRNRL